MDTSLFGPLFAGIAIVALGFAVRRPSNAARRPLNPKDSAPKAKAAAPKEKPAEAEKAPAKSAVPQLGHEEDLDITVMRAVVKDDLAGAENEKNKDAGAEGERKSKTARVELSFEEEADIEEATAPVARILVYAAGDSDRGQKRSGNEDSILVLPEFSLFAVADGMGGYHGGAVASTLAIDTMQDAFERGVFEGKVESDDPLPRRGHELARAMQMSNRAIRSMAEHVPALSQMGTTLVAARFSPNKQRVYIGHVGDSRCYRVRGEELRQITRDHTLSALGVKGAHANELYQALGVKADIIIDLIVDKPQDKDIYLLCSDGLNKMVKDDEIRRVLVSEPDLEAAMYGLMELANDRGGKDNISLILVKVLARVPRDLKAMC